MRRLLLIGAGVLLGWGTGELLLVVYAMIRPGSPERSGFPIENLVTVYSARIAAILLGASVGNEFANRIGVRARRVAGGGAQEPSRQPIEWFRVLVIAAFAAVLIGVTVVVPSIKRFDNRRASREWLRRNAEQLERLQGLAQEWPDLGAAKRFEAEFIELLGTTTMTDGEWAAATTDWSDNDWRRFVALVSNSPTQFVGWNDRLVSLVTRPASSEPLRDESLAACFLIAKNRDLVALLWRSIRRDKIDAIRLGRAVTQHFDDERPTLPVPEMRRWLVNDEALSLLTELGDPLHEVAPLLVQALDDAEQAAGSLSEKDQELIARGRLLVARWEQRQ